MKRIRTVEHIDRLARAKRSVTFANWDRPCAAAFIIGMQARTVLQFIQRGLYEYQPKTKRAKA